MTTVSTHHKYALPQPFTTRDLFEKVVEANKCVSRYVSFKEATGLLFLTTAVCAIAAAVFPAISATALTLTFGGAVACVGFNYLARRAQDDVKDYEFIFFKTTYNRSDTGRFYACADSNVLLKIDRENEFPLDERRFTVCTK